MFRKHIQKTIRKTALTYKEIKYKLSRKYTNLVVDDETNS